MVGLSSGIFILSTSWSELFAGKVKGWFRKILEFTSEK